MPAKSKAFLRLAAMSEHGVPTNTPCPNMTKAQLHDFAATPEKGLPEHTKARDRSTKGSPAFTDQELTQGFRRLG